jgi:tetratricopeptide (TPR) repeat protein
MKLSACMIVKNEAEMLGKNLPGLAQALDEIIVVDTGSSDGTAAVAQSCGARVFTFPWTDDFAAARNESLLHATGDWIIWLDADELLPAADLLALRQFLETTDQNACAVMIYESKLGLCERKLGYRRVKVFRNHLGYHFVRPVNEQLVAPDNRVVTGPEVGVAIYHWGKYLAAERLKAKNELYLKLYSEQLARDPADQYTHLLLANKLREAGDLPGALEHYAQAYQLAPQSEVGRTALEAKATILLQQKKLAETARTAALLLTIDPNNICARNTLAALYLFLGQTEEALKNLQAVLLLEQSGTVENLYQSVGMTNLLLGQAYEAKGEPDRAREYYQRTREIAPEMLGEN